MNGSTNQTKRDSGQEEHQTNRKPANKEFQDLRGKLNQGRTGSATVMHKKKNNREKMLCSAAQSRGSQK
jgi:hypothetical protein